MIALSTWLARRLPFFYGWAVIGVAFITMGIGVNSRTAFSLLFPPILDEFGWSRGVTAAAFSLGFVASVLVAPFTGVLMDRFGPRVVVSLGAALVSLGLALTTRVTSPLGLYLTLGGLVVGASVFMSYIGHSAFLPRWFARRRGLAIGIAFSGVGVGSIILFPLLQQYIGSTGWREACLALAALIVVTIIPLNVLLQRTQPQDLGLLPDGDSPAGIGKQGAAETLHPDVVVDRAWAEREWTLGTALRTARYWWIFFGLLSALYAWYAVQVHQTRYLVESGFSENQAALALGLVGLTGIAGQIGLGHLSDRIGREIGWTLACTGYALCYGLLLVLPSVPHLYVVYAVAAAQGVLGYGIAPIYSAIAAEIFQGRHFGAIFGTLSVGTTMGAASGPWVTGVLYDLSGSYTQGFAVALVASLVSIGCVWMAAPRRIRLVAGRAEKRARERGVLLPSAPPRPARLSTTEAVYALALRNTPIVIGANQRREIECVPIGRRARPVECHVDLEWRMGADLAELGARVAPGSDPLKIVLVAGPRPGQGDLTAMAPGADKPVSVTRRVVIEAPDPDGRLLPDPSHTPTRRRLESEYPNRQGRVRPSDAAR